MRMRVAVATLLLLPLLTGCPGDRYAQRTLHGSNLNAPTPLRGPAPPALAVIGQLRAPESVLFDPQQDLYFISNINGSMLSVDANGFISRVNPNTMQVELKWIESGKNGVRLDGPKGMAIVGETLYVSDITAVRKFNRRTGAPEGEIALAGASFINDITTDGKSIYVSDTGVTLGPGTTFLETGTDTIWKITNDRPEKLASSRDLGNPNGLDWYKGALRVITFGSNELYELDGGKKSHAMKVPAGQLDGIVHLEDGTPVISSWRGDEIFRGAGGDDFEAILAGMDAPADLGYDTKRHRLLIPHPTANQVTIHHVQ
jgi:hypothetical protein